MRMRGRREEIQHAASIGSESIAPFECYTTWAWARVHVLAYALIN
jgi:hypothetical protein